MDSRTHLQPLTHSAGESHKADAALFLCNAVFYSRSQPHNRLILVSTRQLGKKTKKTKKTFLCLEACLFHLGIPKLHVEYFGNKRLMNKAGLKGIFAGI